MKHDFDFRDYELPAQIREHKDVCYTVTPIGGPAELKAWRERRAVEDAERIRVAREMFMLKRSFAMEIAAGRDKATHTALKVPETIVRLQQELSGKPVPATIKVDVVTQTPMGKCSLPIFAPTWWQRLRRIVNE